MTCIKKTTHHRVPIAVAMTHNLARQQGNILIMFVVSLFSLLVMASLALDGGHMLLNKGRVQNLADAAALHAAKELDEGATHSEARAAVVAIIQTNLGHSDINELASAVDLSSYDINSNQMTSQLNVSFSQRPDPFIEDNTNAARYVKVEIAALSLNNFLADVFSFNKQVAATALAGPSTALEECFNNLVPMMVCGEDVPPTATTFFGLPKGELYLTKIGSNTSSPIGMGNFQLIRLGSNTGAADIRAALAGEDYVGQSCFSTGTGNASVPTEPGNTVGPVAQGLNTRMGVWQGPVNSSDHPRDINNCQGDLIGLNATGDGLEAGAASKAYGYSTYAADNIAATSCSNVPNPTTGNIVSPNPAQFERRVLNVVIGKCTGSTNGANDVDYLGVGCFFLTQEVQHSGQESYVIGEFIDECSSEGVPSGVSENKAGPYTIVLYHVPGSTDS